MSVHDLRFTPAPASLARGGMLGWARFRLGDGWLVDGVAVRRTLGGEVKLSFPARVDGAGREHAYVLPASDRAEAEVLALVEEALEGLGAPPGRAAIDSAGEEEQAEDGGPGGHGDESTGGGWSP